MLKNNINLKQFYLNNLFNDYTNNMPIWLKEETDKELKIINKWVLEYCDNFEIRGEQIRILDFGCGDNRIYKNIANIYKYKKYACDIFEESEAPSSFSKWLKKNNVEYFKINPDSYQINLENYKKFDIIISLGVDVHLGSTKLQNYLFKLIGKLSLNGILIWQKNRLSTLKGLKLEWKDRKLKYQYRPLSCYYLPSQINKVKNTTIEKTKISHLIRYQRI